MNNLAKEIKSLTKISFLSILVVFIFCYLITGISSTAYAAAKERNEMAEQFTLLSSTFKSGQAIPKRYTADGSDISPELYWTAIPAGTKSFALICEDPDAPAGTWIHWIIYDIPPTKNKLPQGVSNEATLKDQSKQGVNSFHHIGYGGPSPPPGPTHRYFFKLYALDDMFGYESTMSLYKFRDFVQKHRLAQAELMGTYGR